MIVVLQGRLRSTRLPAKGFFTFFGQTIWERMCDIALAVHGVDEVVFTTGDLPENKLIRPLVAAKGVRWFAGSEENVLDRFCRAVESYPGEYLLRLTCDNYLAQPELIESLAAAVRRDASDYGYIAPLSHYAGEIVRCEALRRCFNSGYSEMAREHVTWDLRNDPRAATTVLPPDFAGLDHSRGLTLDTLEDFIRMKSLETNCPALAPARCLEALRGFAASETGEVFQTSQEEIEK